MIRTDTTGRRQRAFTLVELLVVIAIITVLVALLVPLASDMRRSGYRTICISNLHQIGVAFHSRRTRVKNPINPLTWPTELSTYIDDARDIFVCPEGADAEFSSEGEEEDDGDGDDGGGYNPPSPLPDTTWTFENDTVWGESGMVYRLIVDGVTQLHADFTSGTRDPDGWFGSPSGMSGATRNAVYSMTGPFKGQAGPGQPVSGHIIEMYSVWPRNWDTDTIQMMDPSVNFRVWDLTPADYQAFVDRGPVDDGDLNLAWRDAHMNVDYSEPWCWNWEDTDGGSQSLRNYGWNDIKITISFPPGDGTPGGGGGDEEEDIPGSWTILTSYAMNYYAPTLKDNLYTIVALDYKKHVALDATDVYDVNAAATGPAARHRLGGIQRVNVLYLDGTVRTKDPTSIHPEQHPQLWGKPE